MGHILKMKPVFKEMIWGGHKLKDVYGYEIPSDHTGECWAVSAHKNGDCTIENSEFAGKTLSWLFEHHRELFGNIEGEEFPLLVKIIDFIKAIEEDDYDNLLNSFAIEKGDFFYIPSGTLHAICSGSLIYEAQQSSDITYRVYDYHRKDQDGNERQLHVQQSIDVTNVPAQIGSSKSFRETQLENGTKVRYVESEFFKVDCYRLNGKNTVENDAPFQMVSVIEGEGMIDGQSVKKGDHFLICSDQKETVFGGTMDVMIATL